MVLKNPHSMDFVFVLDEKKCSKECMKPKGEPHPIKEGGFWNEFDYSTKCEHLQCFVGNDGENVKECDKIKGAYHSYYRGKHATDVCKEPIIPSSSGDVRLIAVGKQNSPEKPCQFCGSTTICDCPLDVIEINDSSRKLWSGIRVTFPPFDPKGKRYRTKFKQKRYDPKTRTMTVEMELILEEEWKEK
jgi:hypothetical protein